MFSRLPPVTLALLIANVALFLLLQLDGAYKPLMMHGALWPVWSGGVDAPELHFQPWQLVTYAFLHADTSHIFFNMMTLVMFGAQLEHTFGHRRYSLYYAVCVIGAGLCQLALASWSARNGGDLYPTIGASGGVYGLLLAYGLLFPNQRVMLLIPPIPMKARTLVIVFGVLELALGFTGLQPGVAHFAHLGGMLFGGLLLAYWHFGASRPPGPGRLRIVK